MKDLLRLTTAGSVDDGKSTFIGRLLYDSKSLFDDQIESIKNSSKKKGLDIDFSLLTDGLKAEREQGITIDVAYRYFSTPKRKFIIADTPGHIQYTRNMVTGASTANLAIILIDARKGVVEQTKRHSIIASLLQIKHIIFCINKMDLVNYSEENYENIVNSIEEFSAKLDVNDLRFIPISALHGDNLVERSPKMGWYKGSTVLHTLETIHVASDQNLIDCRLPIQTVIRPQDNKIQDYRAYAGRIASGIFKIGDEVIALPSGFTSKIKQIISPDGPVDEAYAPMSISVILEDDIDISRGDMIARVHNKPSATQNPELMICWMDNEDLNISNKYYIRHTSSEATAIIKEIRYKMDVNTLHRNEKDKTIKMNDIARVKIRTNKPLLVDSYRKNRNTGSIILIDPKTNNTVAAGMII